MLFNIQLLEVNIFENRSLDTADMDKCLHVHVLLSYILHDKTYQLMMQSTELMCVRKERRKKMLKVGMKNAVYFPLITAGSRLGSTH